MIKEIFVNLPAKDLNKSKEFWTKIGFSFHPQFTDENGASLILGQNIYAMLLTEKFFQTFIKPKGIADSQTTTEVINAVSVNSKEEVDKIVDAAMAAGATHYRDSDSYDWMYVRTFQDLDSHLWEVIYMDISKFQKS